MDEIPSSSSSWIRFTGFRSCCRDLLCRESWEGDRDGDSERRKVGSHQQTGVGHGAQGEQDGQRAVAFPHS